LLQPSNIFRPSPRVAELSDTECNGEPLVSLFAVAIARVRSRMMSLPVTPPEFQDRGDGSPPSSPARAGAACESLGAPRAKVASPLEAGQGRHAGVSTGSPPGRLAFLERTHHMAQVKYAKNGDRLKQKRTWSADNY
jgi:hypothetical protein